MIMKKGGLTLRKWWANHPQLLHNIPQDELEVNLEHRNRHDQDIRTRLAD